MSAVSVQENAGLAPEGNHLLLCDVMNPAIRLITVSGACGSGKTTLVNDLKVADGRLREVLSHTTREQRPEDRTGKTAYRFWRREVFEIMEAQKHFLWTMPFDGNLYGTKKQDVRSALMADSYPQVLNIDPESVGKLHTFLQSEEVSKAGILVSSLTLVSFFIYVKDEAVLRQRMEMRDHGRPPEYYDQRILECRQYADQIRKYAPQAHWIDNSGCKEDAFHQMMDHLVAHSQ